MTTKQNIEAEWEECLMHYTHLYGTPYS